MKPKRLVLVSRRFWPLVGGAERVMAELASEFQRQGATVTLLTARWNRHWPAQIAHRGVSVIRLPQPSLRWLGSWRYMRALRAWLCDHRGQFDLVYVSMLKHDAYAALQCRSDLGVPIVLRAEGAGETGDVRWQGRHAFGPRIRKRCLEADAVIAPSAEIQRELVNAGYSPRRIHYLANAVRIPPARTDAGKTAARAALAESHPLLNLAGAGPIALYTGRLHPDKGLSCLVTAWSKVAAAMPGAQLWIVGEGPQRETLLHQTAQLGLDGRVVFCGAFDAVDEFLMAADIFILPSLLEGMSLSLLEAMAAGLAIIASDIPANRALIQDGRQGLLVPPRDADALAACVMRLAGDPALAADLGTVARNCALREFALDRAVERHFDLFSRLIVESSSNRPRN